MRTISLYILAIALSAGSAATVRSAMRARSIHSNASALMENSAPFRDGLYLGQLAARNGNEPRSAAGRWASEENRAAFREGYRRGYRQALILRARD
ncbi:MAG TPA: hypothetical protein VEK33_07515 [Terriglobales bacterium]|nr:hypothetical protein [Terriglobales bacterium]